jgi:hypothetical protein
MHDATHLLPERLDLPQICGLIYYHFDFVRGFQTDGGLHTGTQVASVRVGDCRGLAFSYDVDRLTHLCLRKARRYHALHGAHCSTAAESRR